jgi:hypothetical protein
MDFGPFIMVFVLIVALPVSFLMAGAAIAAVLSVALKSNAVERGSHPQGQRTHRSQPLKALS